ncbi:MAG: CDP-glycerol glycerophosphotransferase family protein [Clostridia bacterium]|nr:CDP-glycerol glycerophosphotransferase family protein [Clostridia bacterium]MBR6810205.1 CDP-glycerol glycerophosphotransferase family protein [Clostridia bacterium]
MSLMKDAVYLAKVYALRAAQHCLFFLPVRKNRVLFYAHQRKGFCCNLKYMALEMKRRYGEGVEMIWTTEDPRTCSCVEREGIRVVGTNTPRHWLYQLTAGTVIVNDSFHEAVILRKKQVTVNTWHAAMNYKHIGPDYTVFRNRLHRHIMNMRNRQPGLYLSGSRYFTQDTSRSFGFDPAVFAETGCPRNDVFFSDHSSQKESLLYRMGIATDTRIVMYAPTFRSDLKAWDARLDYDRLVAALEARFGGKWIVFYRKHYFLTDEPICNREHVVDVSDYEDANELLAMCDVLVSDYSSCLWDFSLTERPAFVFAPDMAAYAGEDRGFSLPPSRWPFSIACSNEEMEKNILAFSEEEYRQKVQHHHQENGRADFGHAAQKAVDLWAKKRGMEQDA